MNIFSRREVYLTWSLDEVNWITGRLTSSGIDYGIVTNSMTDPGRMHGVPNVKFEYEYEYRIYVHKNDYDRAMRLIRN